MSNGVQESTKRGIATIARAAADNWKLVAESREQYIQRQAAIIEAKDRMIEEWKLIAADYQTAARRLEEALQYERSRKPPVGV